MPPSPLLVEVAPTPPCPPVEVAPTPPGPLVEVAPPPWPLDELPTWSGVAPSGADTVPVQPTTTDAAETAPAMATVAPNLLGELDMWFLLGRDAAKRSSKE